MRSDYHPFPETHWSLVRRAGNVSAEEHGESLRVLLNRYEPALRSYLVNVRSFPEADADDHLQSFIADKILEAQLLRHADERRGRFRSFLLTCLNHFIALRRRRRAGEKGVELREIEEPESPAASAAAHLEAEWARSLLSNVLDAMRYECERSGRLDVWRVFDQRVLSVVIRNEAPEGYERMAASVGVGSPSQAANLLVTAKRMYARLLRRAIAEYEETEAGIEEEIGELRAVLGRAGPMQAGRQVEDEEGRGRG